MPSGTFTIDANIVSERWTHHIEHDHHDNLPDTRVELGSGFGPYAAGALVSDVLADLNNRLTQLENNERYFDSFTIDAAITDRVFTIDAIISGTTESSFTIDAKVASVGQFTIDAKLVGRFTIDAFIV